MTFGGHVVYLWPEYHVTVQMMLEGTETNYMPDKIHAIISIINTRGQIVQIHLIRKNV